MRVKDAPSCQAWLDTLAPSPRDRVTAISVLLERLLRGDVAPDPCFECLELARVELVVAIEDAVRPLQVAPIPFAPEQRAVLTELHGALLALRDAFKRVYARMSDARSLDTRSVIPGATNALRVALPLARALDAQSRAIALLLRCRTMVGPQAWDELGLMAQHMRRTTFLDQSLPDRVALTKPNTSRGAFIYPLLLLFAGCEGFPAAERAMIDKLARRWATRVGFGYEAAPAGSSRELGALLITGAGPRLRLLTEKLLRSLESRRSEWLSDERRTGRAALGLDTQALTELLDHLDVAWGAEAICDVSVRPLGAALRVRFGLPTFWGAHTELGLGKNPGWSGMAATTYRSGSWESDSVLHRALGSVASGRDPISGLMAEGQSERIHRIEDDLIVLDRHSPTPSASLGDIVALLPVEKDDDGKAERSRLVLGRVVSLQQFAELSGDSSPTLRVGVRILPGRPVPVGVKVLDELEYSDAFLLRSAEGVPTVIAMRSGDVPKGARISMCEGADESRVFAIARVGYGPGYQLQAISSSF